MIGSAVNGYRERIEDEVVSVRDEGSEKHAERARERELLEQIIEDAKRRSGTLGEVLQRRRGEMAKLRGHRNRLSREKVLLERRIQEIENSRSWRLTAPLRRFMRLVRRQGEGKGWDSGEGNGPR